MTLFYIRQQPLSSRWSTLTSEHCSSSMDVPERCNPWTYTFFRRYKSFIRSITDAFIIQLNVNIWHRDRFLALQSFAINQWDAPRFKNLIRYAFNKTRYVDESPGPWIKVHAYCFDSITADECSKCEELAFVKCVCERKFSAFPTRSSAIFILIVFDLE